ncbi:hypothetical protein AAVH_07590 [Aphelenchoides avenae]|nr:hypothetical protein AAVH_07590 [Aphelenchus avenae]
MTSDPSQKAGRDPPEFHEVNLRTPSYLNSAPPAYPANNAAPANQSADATATAADNEASPPPPVYTAAYPPGTYPAAPFQLYGRAPRHGTAYVIETGAHPGCYYVHGDRSTPVYFISSHEINRRRRLIAGLSFVLLAFPIILFLIIFFSIAS